MLPLPGISRDRASQKGIPYLLYLPQIIHQDLKACWVEPLDAHSISPSSALHPLQEMALWSGSNALASYGMMPCSVFP